MYHRQKLAESLHEILSSFASNHSSLQKKRKIQKGVSFWVRLAILASLSSCITRSNSSSIGRTRTATEKFVQLRAKLFACDQVHVKVISENKTPQSIRNCDSRPQGVFCGYGTPSINQKDNAICAKENNVKERSGDEHDGRNGRVGRGWLSEIGRGVFGRSSYFTQYYHVDD